MSDKKQDKASKGSARNTNRPGLLSTESPEGYDQHVKKYLTRFQPIDSVERDLVDRMIAAAWREKRLEVLPQGPDIKSAARAAYASAIRSLKELQGDRFNRQPSASPVARGKIIEFRPRDKENTKFPFEPKRPKL